MCEIWNMWNQYLGKRHWAICYKTIKQPVRNLKQRTKLKWHLDKTVEIQLRNRLGKNCLNQSYFHVISTTSKKRDDIEWTWKTDWIERISYFFIQLLPYIQWKGDIFCWYRAEFTWVNPTKCKSKLEVELRSVPSGKVLLQATIPVNCAPNCHVFFFSPIFII